MALQDLINMCLSKISRSRYERLSAIPMALAVLLVSNAATAEETSRSIKIDRPVMSLSPTQVCSGTSYYDLEGNPLDGKLDCDNETCAQDGATGCLATLDYPAANTANFSGSDLKDGKTIAGIAGALKNCNTDGQSDCIANAAFKAAEMANVTAGKIKKDATIAGVLGDYPSATYTLVDAGLSAYGLTTSNFLERMKSNDSFDFWDNTGKRHSKSGFNAIIAENIKHGVQIFGVTGTIQPYDVFDTADLRAGVKIGEKTGSLKIDCRNTAPGPGNDLQYTTIEDNNLPTEKPWEEKHYCAGDIWEGKYNESGQQGTCTSLAKPCVWQNTVTKTLWGGNEPNLTNQTFENAKNNCDGLTAAGHSSGWRLPTQKELMSAYTQGAVWMAGSDSSLRGPEDLYWSSTAVSDYTGNRYVVNMRTGEVTSRPTEKSVDLGVICVHD